jgi:hypothetical protein
MSEEAGLSPEEMLQTVLNDPTASEDCLFLDVLVPVNVFKQVQADANRGTLLFPSTSPNSCQANHIQPRLLFGSTVVAMSSVSGSTQQYPIHS